MHRHAAFVAFLSLALFAPLAACGGPGLICSDPSDYSTCEPAPDPTPDPPGPPARPPGPRVTPTPVPAGCIGDHDAVLLWPFPASALAAYQNVVYIAVPRTVTIPAYVLLELGFRSSAGVDANFERAPLQDVTGSLPSYVPAPFSDRPIVYAAAGLPIDFKGTVDIILTDSRRPAQCADVLVSIISTVDIVR
ncbi:MAG TPA: hypothetical protein VGC96_12540 [Candidatus Elarobacter sp.]|jgi:hypothetical protein